MEKIRLLGVAAIFVAIAICLVFAGPKAFANDDLKNGKVILGSTSSIERQILGLVNDERLSIGSGGLILNARLADAARANSEKMANHNYFGHKGPDGKGLVARMNDFNITNWSGIGENLYFCEGFDNPSAAAVLGWMKSSGHRSNMLNRSWKSTGIGVYATPNGRVYVTQIFLK